MTIIAVTGASGFIGKHLVEALNNRPDTKVVVFNRGDTLDKILDVEIVYHLAAAIRPKNPQEFEFSNINLTKDLCDKFSSAGKKPTIILTSSYRVELQDGYGVSKIKAEEIVEDWSKKTGGKSIIYRLRGVFGKWCKPNYNSVVATFCYNISHDKPITVSDSKKEIRINYIDDVIKSMLSILDESNENKIYREVFPMYDVTLGDLVEKIQAFDESRRNLKIPNLTNRFDQSLYATYLSYLDKSNWEYTLDIKTDNRGCLAEFIKSDSFGQIFVSRTKPGITRGNHYHHTKIEKFFVIEGDAIIRLRSIIDKSEIIEFKISGKDMKVVNIPPGYTHSIENVGNTELITIFWSDEVYNPEFPDTRFENVLL